ncbi:M56 family metallopeptidase [Nocardia sp. NBC_00511]|uniref:M56 family metallopeptidase n=1 Tax=Nocardia sp. NBC_00511 TaxID=2903591 RepID=UPI0030E063FA
MSVAVCLLLYGFAVAVLAPRLLHRVSADGAAPHLALSAWLAAMGSTLLAWTVTLILFVIDLISHQIGTVPAHFMDSCLVHLHDAAVGRYGGPVQSGLLALSGFASLAGMVVAVRLIAALLRSRRRTLEHGRMARMAGRHNAELDAVVLEVDHPAAYCVAGKPHTVVVSRGVLTALDDEHLEAVLTHERAHLAGRHHLLLALTRGLATVLPRIDLFTVGATEVSRLLEMIADEAAADVHGRHIVHQALVTLSEIPTESGLAAHPVLTSRIDRLTRPHTPVALGTRLTATAAATTATLIPIAAIIAAFIGIEVCAGLD